MRDRLTRPKAAPETISPAQLSALLIDHFIGVLPLHHDRDGVDPLALAKIRLPERPSPVSCGVVLRSAIRRKSRGQVETRRGAKALVETLRRRCDIQNCGSCTVRADIARSGAHASVVGHRTDVATRRSDSLSARPVRCG